MALLDFEKVAGMPVPDNPEERLIIVPPDAPEDMLESLVKGERVHHIHDIGELRRLRLGHARMDDDRLLFQPLSTKVAFALVAADNRIRSVVYASLTYQPEQEGVVKFQSLPGKLDTILTTPSAPLSNLNLVNTIGFYSISNLGKEAEDPGCKGAGPRLISAVFHMLSSLPVVRTTISPFRGFTEWLAVKAVDIDDAAENLINYALERILDNVDLVQQFHLRMGTVLADLKQNSNSPGSEDARYGRNIAVNYAYLDPNTLKENKALYKQGIICMARDLFEKFSPAQQETYSHRVKLFDPEIEVRRQEPDQPSSDSPEIHAAF